MADLTISGNTEDNFVVVSEQTISVVEADIVLVVPGEPTVVEILDEQELEVADTTPSPDIAIVTILEPGPRGAPGFVTKSFRVQLSQTLVDNNEVAPGVIRIIPPESPEHAVFVKGYVDGREMEPDKGWRVAPTGTAFDLYVPTDAPTRNRYITAAVRYSFDWIELVS
jgi:hypothetical protein